MRAYWWKMPGGACNFGDDINRFILEKMAVDFEHVYSDCHYKCPPEAELVVCGSVLEHLPEDWAGTVCGAGILYPATRLNLSSARVLALRGKMTRSAVVGVGSDVVLGDPGLLVPRWIRPSQPKYPLGVVPHWSDTELRGRFSYGRYIDPRQPAEKVIEQIIQCKSVISSSLHGIVIADAYGIPRQAELPFDSYREGGDFKYRDYTSVYDEEPMFGTMHRVDRRKVGRVQGELYAALQTAVSIDLPSVDLRREPQISLLVPFRDDGEHRSRVWRWLRRYWRSQGMDAEIIQASDDGTPFSKAVAVNNAARIARGRVFAVVDADTYLSPTSLTDCAKRIEGVGPGRRLWMMPYNELYRLSEKVTAKIIEGDPRGPVIDFVPGPGDTEVVGGHTPYTPYSPFAGHEYGAMAQVMPREAFLEVNGMDPRFRGWGSEDVSLLRSLDCLWGQHEVYTGRVLHLWHARIGSGLVDRQWVGQSWGLANSRLADRYAACIAEPGFMRVLADEHPLD